MNWKRYQTDRPTEAEVKYWWRRWPEANIILITGKVSGFVVIDVDPRHAGDEAWEAWTKHNPVPDTVRSLTGGGGTHYLFEWPGEETPNGVNLLPGVDYRGDGGYIVAPPSRHELGGRYDWDVVAHPDDTKIAKMPQALLRLVTHRRAAAVAERVDINQHIDGNKLIGQGERNDLLARIAGRFVKSCDSLAELVRMLDETNTTKCAPPLEDAEVKRIALSIWRRENDNRKDTEAVVEEAKAAPPEDLQIVAKLLGVHITVTDWFILRGALNEYVLVTPEDEIRLGANLLNYDALATRIFNETGELMAGKKDWAIRAVELRKMAREEFIEPLSANDQITEWLGEYIHRAGVHEVDAARYAERLQAGPLKVGDEVWIRPVHFSRFIESTFGEKMLVPELRKLLKRSGWAEGLLEGGVKAWHRSAPDAPDSSSEETA